MSERFEEHAPTSAAFPPRELWLYDPIKEGRLEVLYDPYGLNLVDLEGSLDLLLSTVETRRSGYKFNSEYADYHHAEHDEAFYPYLPLEEINPRAFRTLACNQYYLGRTIHAWWHRVFETPKIATQEGMKLRLDAQKPITLFANSVKYVNEISHDANMRFDNVEFRDQIRQRLGFYSSLLNSLREVPEEFQIIPTNDLYVEAVDDAIRIARRFTRYARPKAPLPIVLNSSESHHNTSSVAA